MAILVLGASGFIGGRIVRALRSAGLAVREGARPRYDLTLPRSAADWMPLLEDTEAVVNAVGIVRESGTQTFAQVHARGPVALFEACARLGIPVVQVSALGADADAPTAFLRSKARADQALLESGVPALVLRPSLVFGPGGMSAHLFLVLASMPVIPLPPDGEALIQPVHVDDVVQAVVVACRERHFPRRAVAVVGPEALSLREYLSSLREQLGFARSRFLPMPRPLVALAASLRVGLLDRDALRMLEAGNAADASDFTRLLGHAPRSVDRFIPPEERPQRRAQASLGWLLPVLRLAIAFMWIAAAVVSAGLFPVEESEVLLAQVGLSGALATLALYGAAALDLALGIATLIVHRRMLWTLQLVLILGYTIIITIFLPAQWLHPFGPVVKNIPILAAILLMRELEAR
jgi:uncharacterized protein YbjT (DUF2867 family)